MPFWNLKYIKGNCLRLWGAVLGERGWWLSALLVLACAHADRFEVGALALAVAEPAPPDPDRLRRCG